MKHTQKNSERYILHTCQDSHFKYDTIFFVSGEILHRFCDKTLENGEFWSMLYRKDLKKEKFSRTFIRLNGV